MHLLYFNHNWKKIIEHMFKKMQVLYFKSASVWCWWKTHVHVRIFSLSNICYYPFTQIWLYLCFDTYEINDILTIPLCSNTQDDGGWTPIVWATESVLPDTVRYLLGQGGDPNKKDNVSLFVQTLHGTFQGKWCYFQRGITFILFMNSNDDWWLDY